MAKTTLFPEIWRGERSLWQPFREMNRLQRRMNRLFDDFLTDPWQRPFEGMLEGMNEELPMQRQEFVPMCDVEETDNSYLLSFDLPGMKKEEIKIHIQDNILNLSGERKMEARGKVSRERYFGSFSRSFTLPQNADSEHVNANYENGLLTISIPKIATSEAKEIPIHAGKLLEKKPEAQKRKPEEAA